MKLKIFCYIMMWINIIAIIILANINPTMDTIGLVIQIVCILVCILYARIWYKRAMRIEYITNITQFVITTKKGYVTYQYPVYMVNVDTLNRWTDFKVGQRVNTYLVTIGSGELSYEKINII